MGAFIDTSYTGTLSLDSMSLDDHAKALSGLTC
jgi:hypothetical protein